MARMFPNRIPLDVASDPRRGAERRVYDRLQATLDDSFTVFGWVPWLRQGAGGSMAEGEADFLIAHEREGLLAVEIKGGRVSRNGESGRWTSHDRDGRPHDIPDPELQARRSQHLVLHRLREIPGLETRWIGAGHAVVFPDCDRPPRDLALHLPLRICAFAEDMANLGPCLRRVLRSWIPERMKSPAAGPEGIAALESLVAGSFDLRAPLGTVLKEEDRAILHLTEEQYRVLDGLAGNSRVLVAGGPGTGKTMLAMEQARRLASQGRSTLLTCFNRPLADYLGQSTGGRDRITIWNFHQLCYQWARRAGLQAEDPDGPQAENLPDAYFRHDLPRLFLDALDRLDDRFDSIVVDEGQDFVPDYWDALQLAFRDLTRATLHVFQDAAQDIYSRHADSLSGMVSYALQENLRNTRQIHRVLAGICSGLRTVARGPAGIHPERIAAVVNEEPVRLAGIIQRLIGNDRVAASDIAVLTTSRSDIERLAPSGRIGDAAVTRDHLERSERVLIESVPRFKGLERRVVVLAGLRESRHVPLEKLLCVGASRARVHLVVIADAPILARLDSRDENGPMSQGES